MTGEKFNQSEFSIWINSGKGRVFRLIAGTIFFVIGIIYFQYPLGVASLIWGFFPLSAGGFDICYISGVLGGPFKGSKIRALQSNLENK